MPPSRLFTQRIIIAGLIPVLLSATTIYLNHRLLPASKTKSIKIFTALSPSIASSYSLRIVNPKNHAIFSDSRSITLSKKEVGSLTDEEILARFVRGFFEGWVFTPERWLIGGLGMLGRKLVFMSFEGAPDGECMSPLAKLSRTKLPERYTQLYNANFMVLDVHVRPQQPMREGAENTSESEETSYVDIGFGCDLKQFSGMHRFEILRAPPPESIADSSELAEKKLKGDNDKAVTIWYSSLSCNPAVNKPPFPRSIARFHELYAQILFRDGIREVLKG